MSDQIKFPHRISEYMTWKELFEKFANVAQTGNKYGGTTIYRFPFAIRETDSVDHDEPVYEVLSNIDTEEDLERCGCPFGIDVFRRKNGAGGWTYWADDIGGGRIAYDTCLDDPRLIEWIQKFEQGLHHPSEREKDQQRHIDLLMEHIKARNERITILVGANSEYQKRLYRYERRIRVLEETILNANKPPRR